MGIDRGGAGSDEPLEWTSVPVSELLAGVRVDRAVAMLAGISRAEAADAVAAGRVTLDGQTVRHGNRPLYQSSLLAYALVPAAPFDVPAEPDLPLAVVHADDQVVVVDKPPGMVVHPGAGRHRGTLVGALLARYPDLAELVRTGVCDPRRPGIVHRLDRGTSGLMVVARTEPAYRSLVAQFGRRSVGRRYLALVRGHLAEDLGVVEAPIGRSHRSPTRMAVSAQGKPARTHFRVVARYELPVPATLLVLALDTGRTHQIRVHLSAIGHPVAGDDRYGPGRPGSPWALPSGRLFLHASGLAFDHPGSGARCSWWSPLPPDLADLLPRALPLEPEARWADPV